jgi:hypothetical protein
MKCVDPTDPFGTRGHDGGRGPGDLGVPTDSPGGEKPPRPPKDTHGCTYDQLQSDEAGPCLAKVAEDVKNNAPEHYLRCSKTKMECCQTIRSRGKTTTTCTKVN